MTHPALFYPKDFIETAEGLLLAVVASGLEKGRVLCFLRYVRGTYGWQKQSTAAANLYLHSHYPDYLFFSETLNAHLHGIPVNKITVHHQPVHRLQALMQSATHDTVESDLYMLANLLANAGLPLAHFGVTGSILPGVHNDSSDIDLVCYDREIFQLCRARVRDLITQGWLSDLSELDWQIAYQRREADFSYQDYVWHERRKHNKALVNKRKFDLSLLNRYQTDSGTGQKLGLTTLHCCVIDDSLSFDYPACFMTDHNRITSILSFTATYTGQAFKGETIEARGIVEQTPDGSQRLIVGSNREAKDQYIKVIRP